MNEKHAAAQKALIRSLANASCKDDEERALMVFLRHLRANGSIAGQADMRRSAEQLALKRGISDRDMASMLERAMGEE